MSEQLFSKNLGRSIIIGAIILVVGYVVKGQLSKKDEKATPKISFRSKIVETVPAATSALPINVNVSGRLLATNRMDLYAEVSGILHNNSFKSGQRFGSGQSIAVIDDSEYKAQLTAARSSFMGLLSQSLVDISLDYPEEAPTWQAFLNNIQPNQKLPDLPKIENNQLKRFLSGRNILSNYYTIQSQEVRLNKYRITAPYSGLLSETSIYPGTLVQSGQKIGTFVQQGTYELETAVTRSDLIFLKKGSKVSLRSQALSKEYQGTVSRINSTINPTTQLVSVFLTVKGADLKEGMYLDANIQAGLAKDAISIDRNILVDGKSIYTITADSTLTLMPVKVITYSEDQAIIEGIPPGTSLPLNPVSGAFEGMKIIPKPAQ